ncbi:MAG: putative membrane protein [Cyclobacteriaceae bacterium]|jgi:putative membrane protein
MLLLFWIFAIPYRISGQRMGHETALDILKKRMAFGKIINQEYLKKRNSLSMNNNFYNYENDFTH